MESRYKICDLLSRMLDSMKSNYFAVYVHISDVLTGLYGSSGVLKQFHQPLSWIVYFYICKKYKLVAIFPQ